MHITPNTPRRAGLGVRKLVLAASAAAALGALAMPAMSDAAVTFGSSLEREPSTTEQQRQCAPAASPCTRVGYVYPDQDPQIQASPIDGVVVKFRLRSQTTNPVTFRVARLTPQDPTTMLGTGGAVGPTVALKGDESIEEFGAQVPIKNGDHLALEGDVISAQYSNDGGKRHYIYGPKLVEGQGPRAANDTSSKQLLLQAVVEPDSDKDGRGDETQDQCPTDPSTGGACPTPDNTAPILNGVAFAPGSFRAAAVGGAIASRAPVGARVFYRLSETATVTWGVEKGTVGRRVGGRCVKKTRGNASKRRCLRFVRLIGSFKTTGGAGQNGFRYSGRLNGHKLAPGSYKLVGTAKDPAGNKSKTRKRNFRIVK
jgi:hypothetical protein